MFYLIGNLILQRVKNLWTLKRMFCFLNQVVVAADDDVVVVVAADDVFVFLLSLQHSWVHSHQSFIALKVRSFETENCQARIKNCKVFDQGPYSTFIVGMVQRGNYKLASYFINYEVNFDPRKPRLSRQCLRTIDIIVYA